MTAPRRGADADLLEAARALHPLIEASADRIETERQLPPSLVDAMAAAGLFTALVPHDLGGAQAAPATCARVIEEVATADGSAAWCVMVAATNAFAAGAVSEGAAQEIWGHNLRAYVAGSAVGNGTAVAANGGYRVSGRWSFASGCQHATWLMLAVAVHEQGQPRLGPDGSPESLFVYLPPTDCQIVDAWNVLGMRGAGSHDIVVADAFVPGDRILPRSFGIPPRHPAPLYAFGARVVPTTGDQGGLHWSQGPILAIGMAAVTLGIARGALAAFAALAATKAPTRGACVLRDDPVIQDRFARVLVSVRAARALLYQTVDDVWHPLRETGEAPSDGPVRVRLSSTYAAETAVTAVETVWKMAGTSGVFLGSPFERRLRDVQVGAQNVVLSQPYYAVAGQSLLQTILGHISG